MSPEKRIRGSTLLLIAAASMALGTMLWLWFLQLGGFLASACHREPTAGVCPWIPRAIYAGMSMVAISVPCAVVGVVRFFREPVRR